MSLEPGTRIGACEVLSLVGAGGMGEVYRARDTKLERDVAIKILPDDFADDEQVLKRFEREAKLLAAVNHPNVGTLYGLEESEGRLCLVMELVEGRTLEEIIFSGSVAIESVIATFRQIAEGLDAAHEKGIVHRDLKPSNVKITPQGRVKLLDFGLGKFLTSPFSDGHFESATLARDVTAIGTIVGTVNYMSPEQLRGRPVDARSDIWSLGCCFYEAITRKAPFRRESIPDTVAAVLEHEPEPLEECDPSIAAVVMKCLRKDPAQRWQSARELADGLGRIQSSRWLLTERHAGHGRWTGKRLSSLGRTAAIAILAALAGVAVAWTVLRLDPAGPRRPVHLETSVPTGYHLNLLGGSLALSPNGELLAFTAQSSEGPFRLFLRALSERRARPIEGTDGAWNPFFSRDGQWVGYQAQGALFKVPIAGGSPPVRIAEARTPIFGAVWLEDDTIVFGGGRYKGLFRVPASGGVVAPLTEPDAGALTHGLPQVLPDGEHVLFTVETATGSSVSVLSLVSGETKEVLDGGSAARFVAPDHLVFAKVDDASAGVLMAAAFDPETCTLRGLPVAVVESVYSYATVRFALAQFDLSDNGVLVYIPASGAANPEQTTSLVWVDRDGNPLPHAVDRRGYIGPRFSAIGREIVASHRHDIWRVDLVQGTHTRLTFDEASFLPIWRPDEKGIAYTSNGNLHYLDVTTGEGPRPLLPRGNLQHTGSWSPDGKLFAYHEHHPTTGMDIWTLPFETGGSPTPVLVTPFNEGSPHFSPSGRFLAYVSDEGGRFDVYVRAFPSGGGKRAISVDGGREPTWSKDGRELYYRSGNRLMVVSVTEQPEFRASEPRVLFEGNYWTQNGFLNRNYDVSPDGQSFIILRQEEEEELPARLYFVLNWSEELKVLDTAQE